MDGNLSHSHHQHEHHKYGYSNYSDDQGHVNQHHHLDGHVQPSPDGGCGAQSVDQYGRNCGTGSREARELPFYMNSMEDRDVDGYDGASERGRYVCVD